MDILPGNIHTKPTVKVGFVVKTHGYKGQVVCAFYEEFQSVQEELVEAILHNKFILLEIDGQWVPFEIEHFIAESALLKLKNIDAVEIASLYTGCPIHVPDIIVSELFQEQQTLIGYAVFNQQGNLIGNVVDLIEMPGHDLIEVELHQSQQLVLLPFHEELIIELSNENQTITLHITDGLLDL